MRMLDFFSGLGGASEAMIGEWDVMRFENNELLRDVPNTQITDLTEPLMLNTFWLNPDLVWCSPPCVDFSDGYSAPKAVAKREGREYNPDMSLVKRSIELIEQYKPKYWVIENVRGAQPFFLELLGKPKQIFGSIYLWGNYPLIDVGTWKMGKKEDDWSTNPLRANIRAKIPIEISQGLKRAVETQRSLLEWC